MAGHVIGHKCKVCSITQVSGLGWGEGRLLFFFYSHFQINFTETNTSEWSGATLFLSLSPSFSGFSNWPSVEPSGMLANSPSQPPLFHTLIRRHLGNVSEGPECARVFFVFRWKNSEIRGGDSGSLEFADTGCVGFSWVYGGEESPEWRLGQTKRQFRFPSTPALQTMELSLEWA